MRCVYSWITAFLLLWALPVSAQVSFTVSTPSEVVAEKPFQIRFTLNNARTNRLILPDISPLQIVGGPNISQQTRIVNFKQSSSISWTYYIIAPEEGQVTLPAVDIKTNEGTFETEAKTLNVLPASQQHSATQNTSPSQHKPPQQNREVDEEEQLKKDIARDHFVRLEIDKRRAYVGEQITVVAKLYTRINAQTRLVEMPQFSGFWNKSFDVSNEERKVETYNGRKYETLVLGKYALFPQRPGQLTISPVRLQSLIQIQRRTEFNPWDWDPFTDPFPGIRVEQREYDFASPSATITALPLPTPDSIEGNVGAVGSFSLQSHFEGDSLDVNDAGTLTLTVEGTGNLMLFDLPQPEWPSSAEVYDPEVEESLSSSLTIRGKKTWEYVFIPKEPGTHTIPPLTFAYFNPNTERFQTLTTPAYTYQVKGKAAGQNTASSDQDKIQDILPLRTKEGQTYSNPFTQKSTLTAVGLPLLSLLFLFLWIKRKEHVEQHASSYRKKRAASLAHKQLKTAKNAMNKGDAVTFYEQIAQVLRAFTANRFGVEQGEQSQESLKETMLAKGIQEDTARNYLMLYMETEAALYTGESGKKDMQGTYNKAADIITQIDNELKA